MPWHTLGTVAPDRLPHTREQLHCVAQIVANVPRLLAPRQPDYSHSAFDWDSDTQSLISVEIPSDVHFRVGLRVPDATALFLNPDRSELATLPTDGIALEDLLRWFTRQIVDLTASALPRPLADAEDGLPDPCVAGQVFDLADRDALAELGRYYDNSQPLFEQVASNHANATPVRTWPHHMDIGFLIELDPGDNSKNARSVSLGMQPGDDSYPEPYYYSSPWPYPDPEDWPPLEGNGRWHTDDFTAAILLASDLPADDAAAQEQHLTAFIDSAIEANTSLLT